MSRILHGLLALLAAVLLGACGSDAPEPEEVRQAVQEQLDGALGGRVLEIREFRPAGGAPLGDPEGRLVYFNAALELTRDYDFTEWDAHSVATLTALLGAGPRGVFGLNPGGNRAGDELGVYGSAAFVRRNDQWALVPRAPAGDTAPLALDTPGGTVAAVPQQPKEIPPPPPVQHALAELSGLLSPPPDSRVGPVERRAIVLEETERAVRAVRERLSRAASELVLAAGPAGGAYEETARALAARTQPGSGFRVMTSEGSIGNVRLLRDRAAQFALVQNDLAVMALRGRGRFAGAPQEGLRAVASLFPEAIHLVAAAGAGIDSVADLRGKRVNLGGEGSGTRANALAILEAHGLPLDAIAEVSALALPEASGALAEGRIDALFATVHAPARALQQLAARTPVSFVPLGPGAELVASGLVPLNLPPGTYPTQTAPVPTLAATALLVTRQDVDDAQIDAVLQLMFDTTGGDLTAAVSQIGVRSSRRGVTIPWHPRADAFLAGRGAPSAP